MYFSSGDPPNQELMENSLWLVGGTPHLKHSGFRVDGTTPRCPLDGGRYKQPLGDSATYSEPTAHTCSTYLPFDAKITRLVYNSQPVREPNTWRRKPAPSKPVTSISTWISNIVPIAFFRRRGPRGQDFVIQLFPAHQIFYARVRQHPSTRLCQGHQWFDLQQGIYQPPFRGDPLGPLDCAGKYIKT